MDRRQLKQDVRDGIVSADQLLEIVLSQDTVIKRLEKSVARLEERLAQFEPPDKKGPGSDAVDYSLAAEEKRRKSRRRKQPKRRGRRPTAEKIAQAVRSEDVCPAGMTPAQCTLVIERPVWRIENGKAVRVAYRFYKLPWSNDVAKLPGVLPNCEYGLEILVMLSFLVYVIGVSMDQACALLNFFCELPLEKSDADRLLSRLAREWQSEFERLCELIALAAVVFMDETGWNISERRCSLWSFSSALHHVLVFGCRKDAATLQTMLSPDVFDGVAVSDDAAVYANFQNAQKCWAHLIRKAIRLQLLYPENATYREFLDGLLALYHQAKRIAADKRYSRAGREKRVLELEDQLWALCEGHWVEPDDSFAEHERNFANLVNELMRLMRQEELFTFVVESDVDGTNNQSERNLRQPAQARKTGRTSKSVSGARRRSVIQSVLESLRLQLGEFHLRTVVEVIQSWAVEGVSLFSRQLQSLSRADPETSRLRALIPSY